MVENSSTPYTLPRKMSCSRDQDLAFLQKLLLRYTWRIHEPPATIKALLELLRRNLIQYITSFWVD